MEADNAPKWWHADICKIERKRAEIMHINIDNTLNGGKNTRSGKNTHIYPNSVKCIARMNPSQLCSMHFTLHNCIDNSTRSHLS